MPKQPKDSAQTANREIARASGIPGITAFDAIRHVDENGQEYWWARELYPILEYSTWQRFELVIHEAMDVCRKSGGNAEEVFNINVKNPPKQGGRPSHDYRLTRHACYLIVLSGDGSKPVIALAKTYFAISTRRHEIAQEMEDLLRLERTPFLHELDISLNAQIYDIGIVSDALIARFWNAGYRTLYRETASQIRLRKGITRHQLIGDYASSTELAYLIFKGTLAREMLVTHDIQDTQGAITIHAEAGAIVRKAVEEAGGPFPETLPTPRKSYRQLLEEQIERERLAVEDEYGLWGAKHAAALAQAERERQQAAQAAQTQQQAALIGSGNASSSDLDEPVEFGVSITITHQGNDTEYQFASVDRSSMVTGATYSVIQIAGPVKTLLHLFWQPEMPEARSQEHAEALLALEAYLMQIIAQDARLKARYGAATQLIWR